MRPKLAKQTLGESYRLLDAQTAEAFDDSQIWITSLLRTSYLAVLRAAARLILPDTQSCRPLPYATRSSAGLSRAPTPSRPCRERRNPPACRARAFLFLSLQTQRMLNPQCMRQLPDPW